MYIWQITNYFCRLYIIHALCNERSKLFNENSFSFEVRPFFPYFCMSDLDGIFYLRILELQ